MICLSHHVRAFAWEIAALPFALFFIRPAFDYCVRRAGKHRRALMPSRQIPLRCYSWPDDDREHREYIASAIANTNAFLENERKRA